MWTKSYNCIELTNNVVLCLSLENFDFKYIFTQPLHDGQDVTQGQFFKQSKDDLNSKFSFF